MSGTDTIAAIASGHGRSARGIIRLSGPGTQTILDRMLVDAPRIQGAPGVHAARLRLPLENGGESRLPCLLLVFGEGHSYTGEASAEIQLPGNPTLLEHIVQCLLEMPGVRPARPGEYSARAFLNGKMSLDQAEGVQAAIAARSSAELDAAESLISGQTGMAYRDLADETARMLALVEAGIDFTDQEDVVPITPRKLAHGLRNCLFGLECFIGPASAATRSGAARVVLAGAPNAGKSTLFNALLGRQRAVVSETPGTTRDAIAERLSEAVDLVDIAGLDASLAGASAPDRAAQEAARLEINRADVVLWCDPSGRFDRPPAWPEGKKVIRVRTKGDLPHGPGSGEGDVAVCALDGWNLAALRRAIEDAASGLDGSRSAAESAVVPRHRRAMIVARDALRRALETAAKDEECTRLCSPEIVAGEIRLALDALGEITGRVTPDDVIGRVFALFCVGK